MTAPLDEKGHDASTQALLNAFPMADKIAAMYAEVAIRAYLSAVSLPDELEVAGWVMGSSFTTDPLMADYWGKAAKAVTGSDQAHSTIAALRAERDEARDDEQEWLEKATFEVGAVPHLWSERALKAEEDNEALREALEALVDQADHVTAGARTSADINRAARNLFPLCVAARAALNSREKAEAARKAMEGGE